MTLNVSTKNMYLHKNPVSSDVTELKQYYYLETELYFLYQNFIINYYILID